MKVGAQGTQMEFEAAVPAQVFNHSPGEMCSDGRYQQTWHRTGDKNQAQDENDSIGHETNQSQAEDRSLFGVIKRKLLQCESSAKPGMEMWYCKLCRVQCDPDTWSSHTSSTAHCMKYLEMYLKLGHNVFNKQFGEVIWSFKSPDEKNADTVPAAVKRSMNNGHYDLYLMFRSGQLSDFKCEICNCKCFCVNNWFSHVQGSKHKKRCNDLVCHYGINTFMKKFWPVPGPHWTVLSKAGGSDIFKLEVPDFISCLPESGVQTKSWTSAKPSVTEANIPTTLTRDTQQTVSPAVSSTHTYDSQHTNYVGTQERNSYINTFDVSQGLKDTKLNSSVSSFAKIFEYDHSNDNVIEQDPTRTTVPDSFDIDNRSFGNISSLSKCRKYESISTKPAEKSSHLKSERVNTDVVSVGQHDRHKACSDLVRVSGHVTSTNTTAATSKVQFSSLSPGGCPLGYHSPAEGSREEGKLTQIEVGFSQGRMSSGKSTCQLAQTVNSGPVFVSCSLTSNFRERDVYVSMNSILPQPLVNAPSVADKGMQLLNTSASHSDPLTSYKPSALRQSPDQGMVPTSNIHSEDRVENLFWDMIKEKEERSAKHADVRSIEKKLCRLRNMVSDDEPAAHKDNIHLSVMRNISKNCDAHTQNMTQTYKPGMDFDKTSSFSTGTIVAGDEFGNKNHKANQRSVMPYWHDSRQQKNEKDLRPWQLGQKSDHMSIVQQAHEQSVNQNSIKSAPGFGSFTDQIRPADVFDQVSVANLDGYKDQRPSEMCSTPGSLQLGTDGCEWRDGDKWSRPGLSRGDIDERVSSSGFTDKKKSQTFSASQSRDCRHDGGLKTSMSGGRIATKRQNRSKSREDERFRKSTSRDKIIKKISKRSRSRSNENKERLNRSQTKDDKRLKRSRSRDVTISKRSKRSRSRSVEHDKKLKRSRSRDVRTDDGLERSRKLNHTSESRYPSAKYRSERRREFSEDMDDRLKDKDDRLKTRNDKLRDDRVEDKFAKYSRCEDEMSSHKDRRVACIINQCSESLRSESREEHGIRGNITSAVSKDEQVKVTGSDSGHCIPTGQDIVQVSVLSGIRRVYLGGGSDTVDAGSADVCDREEAKLRYSEISRSEINVNRYGKTGDTERKHISTRWGGKAKPHWKHTGHKVLQHGIMDKTVDENLVGQAIKKSKSSWNVTEGTKPSWNVTERKVQFCSVEDVEDPNSAAEYNMDRLQKEKNINRDLHQGSVASDRKTMCWEEAASLDLVGQIRQNDRFPQIRDHTKKGKMRQNFHRKRNKPNHGIRLVNMHPAQVKKTTDCRTWGRSEVNSKTNANTDTRRRLAEDDLEPGTMAIRGYSQRHTHDNDDDYLAASSDKDYRRMSDVNNTGPRWPAEEADFCQPINDNTLTKGTPAFDSYQESVTDLDFGIIRKSIMEFLENLKNETELPGYGKYRSNQDLLKSLTPGERQQVLAIQDMTGIEDTGQVIRALRALSQMDPSVLEILGCIKPAELAKITASCNINSKQRDLFNSFFCQGTRHGSRLEIGANYDRAADWMNALSTEAVQSDIAEEGCGHMQDAYEQQAQHGEKRHWRNRPRMAGQKHVFMK